MDLCAPIEAIPAGVLVVDDAARVVAANAEAARMLREDHATLAGRDVAGLLPGLAALRPGGPAATLTARGRDHVPVSLEVRVGAPEDGGRLVLLREVGSQDLIGEAQRYFDAAFDRSPLAMALYNTDGEFIRINDTFCRMLGRERHELLGTRDQIHTHPGDRRTDRRVATQVLAGDLDTFQREKRFLDARGETVWVIANLTFLRDGAGNPLSWVGQFQDITAQKEAEHRMGRLAERDPLTDLYNRRRFGEELSRRLAACRRNRVDVTVLAIDLDGFKEVNDRYGHAVGDALLVSVANGLRGDLRKDDVLARVGGDEFALLLGARGPADADAVARRVVQIIERSARAEHGEARLSASVGVATGHPAERPDAEDLLRRADEAMYEAKRRRALQAAGA